MLLSIMHLQKQQNYKPVAVLHLAANQYIPSSDDFTNHRKNTTWEQSYLALSLYLYLSIYLGLCFIRVRYFPSLAAPNFEQDITRCALPYTKSVELPRLRQLYLYESENVKIRLYTTFVLVKIFTGCYGYKIHPNLQYYHKSNRFIINKLKIIIIRSEKHCFNYAI